TSRRAHIQRPVYRCCVSREARVLSRRGTSWATAATAATARMSTRVVSMTAAATRAESSYCNIQLSPHTAWAPLQQVPRHLRRLLQLRQLRYRRRLLRLPERL